MLQGEGLVGLTEIESAARRLAGVIIPTPLMDADSISESVDAMVRIKCESLQRGGSFKIRGAFNFLSQLSDDQVAAGVCTYSSGNHGQAVALAGKLRGLRVVVVMPTSAPKVKRDGAERLGAELIFEGTTSVERQERAEALATEQGLVIVPPYDHRHIIAGQGTVGREIAQEWPDVDMVLAPIGGGGGGPVGGGGEFGLDPPPGPTAPSPPHAARTAPGMITHANRTSVERTFIIITIPLSFSSFHNGKPKNPKICDLPLVRATPFE